MRALYHGNYRTAPAKRAWKRRLWSLESGRREDELQVMEESIKARVIPQDLLDDLLSALRELRAAAPRTPEPEPRDSRTIVQESLWAELEHAIDKVAHHPETTTIRRTR